jgi:thioredoxin-related protein
MIQFLRGDHYMKRKITLSIIVVSFLYIFILIPGHPNSGSSISIDWKAYESALSRAKIEEKAIYIYFYKVQCPYCRKMERETLTDSRVVHILMENFLSVKIDVDRDPLLSMQYNIRGVPVSWFLDPQGIRIGALPGFIKANDLVEVLSYICEGHYKTKGFREYIKGKGN